MGHLIFGKGQDQRLAGQPGCYSIKYAIGVLV